MTRDITPPLFEIMMHLCCCKAKTFEDVELDSPEWVETDVRKDRVDRLSAHPSGWLQRMRWLGQWSASYLSILNWNSEPALRPLATVSVSAISATTLDALGSGVLFTHDDHHTYCNPQKQQEIHSWSGAHTMENLYQGISTTYSMPEIFTTCSLRQNFGRMHLRIEVRDSLFRADETPILGMS